MRTFILSSLLLAGCQTVTIRPGGGPVDEREPDRSETQHFFAFGLLPEEVFVDVSKTCEGDIEQLQARNSFLNSFLSGITLGIYTPRQARIWCKSGKDKAVVEGKK